MFEINLSAKNNIAKAFGVCEMFQIWIKPKWKLPPISSHSKRRPMLDIEHIIIIIMIIHLFLATDSYETFVAITADLMHVAVFILKPL